MAISHLLAPANGELKAMTGRSVRHRHMVGVQTPPTAQDIQLSATQLQGTSQATTTPAGDDVHDDEPPHLVQDPLAEGRRQTPQPGQPIRTLLLSRNFCRRQSTGDPHTCAETSYLDPDGIRLSHLRRLAALKRLATV